MNVSITGKVQVCTVESCYDNSPVLPHTIFSKMLASLKSDLCCTISCCFVVFNIKVDLIKLRFYNTCISHLYREALGSQLWVFLRKLMVFYWVSEQFTAWSDCVMVWFSASWALSHYLNQSWNSVKLNLRNHFQRQLKQNSHFNSRKFIWKCHLQNGGHVVLASVC